MAHDDMHVVMCKIMDYAIRRNKAMRRAYKKLADALALLPM